MRQSSDAFWGVHPSERRGELGRRLRRVRRQSGRGLPQSKTLRAHQAAARVLCLTALAWLLLAFAVTSRAAGGDWPMWRHDTSLTGYQPLPAAMKKAPRILARHFVGAGHGHRTFADLRGTGQESDVLVAARARLFAFNKDGRPLWEAAPPGYVVTGVEWVDDLDGDSHKEVVAVAGHMFGTRQAYLILDARTGRLRAAIDLVTGDFSFRVSLGSFVPGERGKQFFVVTSMLQAESGPARSHGEFALWSFDGRRAVRRWAWSPREYYVEYPALLVADRNGDGHTRAVVDSWCHVWVIDLATGTALSHTTWDPQGANQRHYGWNEVVDVDGDDDLDFVNVSLTKHVDVLRSTGAKLELAWTRGWPDPVTTEARSIRPPSDPVADLDGDGRMELVTALFDGLTDKRWHLFVFDAASGAQKAEALDLVPFASVPLWGEGKGRALLCARSGSVQYEPAESCEAWTLREGKLEKLWSSTNAAAFLLKPVKSDDRRVVYFNALNVREAVTADVDGDGRVEFFTSDRASGETQAWGLNADGVLVAKSGVPPSKPPKPATPNLPLLNGTMIPYLLAADMDGDQRNELLLYDNATVTVMELVRSSRTRAAVPLGSEADAGFASPLTPALSPLRGEGARRVRLVESRRSSAEDVAGAGLRLPTAERVRTRTRLSDNSSARIASPSPLNGERAGVRGETNPRHSHSLRLLGTFPSTEIPIVCELLGDGRPSLLTAGRGADGNLWVAARGPYRQPLWRFVFPNSAACGQYSERPHYFTVGHFTGDRHFDVFTYSAKPAARAYVLDGRTGQPVWQRDELPKVERHFQAFGGRASVWDFNRDGADDVLFISADFYCIADGRNGDLLAGPASIASLVKWWAAYASPAVLTRAGETPFIYLGGAYSSRGAISLDGARGLWHEYIPTDRWPFTLGADRFVEGLLPPSKKSPVWCAAQVEADGTLVCFDAATGKHLWKLALPTAPSGIITGDVNSDGEPELVFGGQDGVLRALRDRGDRGELIWKKRFAAPAGTPLLADLNADGKSEIVVSVGDGYVYVLGR